MSITYILYINLCVITFSCLHSFNFARFILFSFFSYVKPFKEYHCCCSCLCYQRTPTVCKQFISPELPKVHSGLCTLISWPVRVNTELQCCPMLHPAVIIGRETHRQIGFPSPESQSVFSHHHAHQPADNCPHYLLHLIVHASSAAGAEGVTLFNTVRARGVVRL